MRDYRKIRTFLQTLIEKILKRFKKYTAQFLFLLQKSHFVEKRMVFTFDWFESTRNPEILEH